MPAKNWTQITLSPLSGALNTRSRPADLLPSEYRYKLNFAINRTGSLCTRSGHAALNLGARSDLPSAVPNWDFHRRDTASRKPPTFLYENTSPVGVRTLLAGTGSSLSYLDNGTSEWTHYYPVGVTEAVWKAASMENDVILTSSKGMALLNVNTNTFSDISSFVWDPLYVVSSAKIAVSFSGVVLLMNTVENGVSIPSRVRWSDYKVGNNFDMVTASVAGFQDLDYGDVILAAIEMLGALYIFTNRAIWRCYTNITTDTIFAFQKIYSEPKNLSGCLAYPNTLITNGRELVWLGNDTIWTFNPYITNPESPDWMLKGSGALFSDVSLDRMDKRCCDSIVAEYRPLTKEVWFSYPQGSSSDSAVCLNNRCLVLNMEYKTVDLVDHGYTAFVNFKPTPGSGQNCNPDQIFIGASQSDYCLKNIGGVHHRDLVSVIGGSKANDIPDNQYVVNATGYFCRAMGMIPLGYPNRKKTLRELLVDWEVEPNALTDQNLLTLRIGNSFALQDPVSENPNCAVQWHEQEAMVMTCPDEVPLSTMESNGMNPSDPLAWTLFEEGNYLYFDLRITGADGISAPMEHDAAFSALRWDTLLG